MAACATAVRSTPQPWLNATNDLETWLDPATLSDDALVESARMGEGSAFGGLIERYQGFCLSRAYSVLRNRGDAEDEVQNAWIKAWTHLGSYEGHGSFCAWLSRIVSNQCLMRLRKAKLMPVTSVDHVIDSEGSFRLEVIDQCALPEDLVGDDEVSCVLTKEIRGVPRLLRDVLIMRDFRQLAMRDIAVRLGISIPAAKSRVMRARLELRLQLVKHDRAKEGNGTLLRKLRRRPVTCMQAC
jgi:RNA polymerase sigma-70 factor, ECF subfamily